jgi:hypothetical protein
MKMRIVLTIFFIAIAAAFIARGTTGFGEQFSSNFAKPSEASKR